MFQFIGEKLCNYLDNNEKSNKDKYNSKGKVPSKAGINKKIQ